MGIGLSSGVGDEALGLRAIAEHGVAALVQDPDEAVAPSMPRAAILADHRDACLPVEEIIIDACAWTSRQPSGYDSTVIILFLGLHSTNSSSN